MRVLVLTPYLPHRKVGHGGGTAVRDLVASLARRHEVLVAALVRPGEETRLSEVEALGVRVAGLPFLDATTRGAARAKLLAARGSALCRSVFSGFPLYVEKYHRADISRQLLDLVEDFQPDAVQIEYLQMSLYVRDLQRWRRERGRTGPRLILNTHELGSIPRRRRAANAGNPLVRAVFKAEAEAWERLQIAAARWADKILCVTPEDQTAYAAIGGENLVTVPLGMDLEAITVDRAPVPPVRVLFVGAFTHRPNVLAADFLLNRVWPTVLQHHPTARLLIAGRGSDTWLAHQTTPPAGVEALGFVDDLSPLFRECAVFAAPLPEGGGIKIKILEAMARGIPVVTTPIGAEGIATPGDDALLIAPCDDTFATALLADLDTPRAAAERAARARAHMESFFAWKAIAARLTALYAGNSGAVDQTPEN